MGLQIAGAEWRTFLVHNEDVDCGRNLRAKLAQLRQESENSHVSWQKEATYRGFLWGCD